MGLSLVKKLSGSVMWGPKMKSPKWIDLSPEQMDALLERVAAGTLRGNRPIRQQSRHWRETQPFQQSSTRTSMCDPAMNIWWGGQVAPGAASLPWRMRSAPSAAKLRTRPSSEPREYRVPRFVSKPNSVCRSYGQNA